MLGQSQSISKTKQKNLIAKFKNLRRVLRMWQSQISNLATTISNTKLLIALLDIMEESRDLTLQEWNFRDLLQNHLEGLLHRQNIYWKQRSNVKWVKFGDASTEFFHARASINHRVNSIPILQDQHGDLKTEHEAKADLLWTAYKDRLCTSEYTKMHFDLSTLLQEVEDLDWLQSPFTKEEIDKVIADLPSNKSPGPDCFNGDFFKEVLAHCSPRFL